MDVSRSGYYSWLRRGPSAREQEDQRLRKALVVLFHAKRGRYGSPRMWREVNANGHPAGRHRVARLMREGGLVARRTKRHRRPKNDSSGVHVAPNILARRFKVNSRNRVWAGDMSFIRTGLAWSYLAVMLDLHSRRVVGWALDSRQDESLALRALQMGLVRRQPDAGLLHHSDQGRPYQRLAYIAALERAGVRRSMSRVGNCWDNAPVESFFKTLKAELTYHSTFKDLAAARTAIQGYIHFYNHQRMHSSLDYQTPVDYERSALT